jgi:hypothetical protein
MKNPCYNKGTKKERTKQKMFQSIKKEIGETPMQG